MVRYRSAVYSAVLGMPLALTDSAVAHPPSAGAPPAATGQPTPAASEPSADAAAPRPSFKPLPFEEDWSAFDPTSGDDVWDPIKHIHLSDEGDVWASFGGEFRLRAESWHSFGFLDADGRDDTFLLGRALLHADVHFGESVRFFVEGESALATDRDLPGGRRTLDIDTLDLQNAFADLVFTFDADTTLTARVGRQELMFGKQRLVSPLPWSNSQRSWDAARAIVTADRWRIDAWVSRFAAVDKYEFNDWDLGPDFHGVYATTTLGGKHPLTLDGYWLYLDDDIATFAGVTDDEQRHTVGARLGGPISDTGFDVDVEFSYQFGELGSADIRAWMAAAELGYTFSTSTLKPRLHLGFDYASGDDDPGDGDINTFNQLFPLGHAYFGQMDVVGRQNIIDASGGLSLRPTSTVTVRASAHFFWRASEDDALFNAGGAVVRPAGASDAREVGQEIDFRVAWKADRHMTIEAGYSHFFAGDFIEDTGPDDDIDWFYLQATYRF